MAQIQTNRELKKKERCKERHNGPVTSVEELKALVNDRRNSEMDLHKSLNLEIRLRRLTFTKVKTTCPLFHQKGLTTGQKIKNLESLITTQLDMRVEATMDDLEEAIKECSEDKEDTRNEECSEDREDIRNQERKKD